MKADNRKSPNIYVGSAVERIEDLRFLRGFGQYLDDVERDGQWHAAVLRSPHAHGRILNLDPSAALALKGVHAVVTAADIPGVIPTIPFRRPNPTIAPYAQPVIANGKVRYVGEPLALILADSAELAEDALQEIAVEINALPAVVDWRGSRESKTVLFDGTSGNVASVFTARCGDTDAVFKNAPYVRRERFSVQRHTALPMETRGLLAEWSAEEERMMVFGAAKLPFFNRRALASMLGLDETPLGGSRRPDCGLKSGKSALEASCHAV
jgi:carbon-monoxide dehydrogenase large subunit